MPLPVVQPEKTSFWGLSREMLNERIAQVGWPAYRAKQLRDWVYRKGVADPEQMTNFSKAERKRLADVFEFAGASLVRRQESSDGTLKLLLGWRGGRHRRNSDDSRWAAAHRLRKLAGRMSCRM